MAFTGNFFCYGGKKRWFRDVWGIGQKILVFSHTKIWSYRLGSFWCVVQGIVEVSFMGFIEHLYRNFLGYSLGTFWVLVWRILELSFREFLGYHLVEIQFKGVGGLGFRSQECRLGNFRGLVQLFSEVWVREFQRYRLTYAGVSSRELFGVSFKDVLGSRLEHFRGLTIGNSWVGNRLGIFFGFVRDFLGAGLCIWRSCL